MSFGSPLGLVTLLALGPLIAAYFLRRRQKPREVSALFLWRTPNLRAEAGPRFERFSREISLALEAAAIVAASLFLANLQCGKTATQKHVVVVLDGSLSMRATAGGEGGEPAFQKAVREVAGVVAAEGAGALTVIESGPHPKLLAGPAADAPRALSDLARWRPLQPAHDFGPALAMARELAPATDLKIRLFTDGPPPSEAPWPDDVEAKSVGQPDDNAAFLAAERRDEAGVARVDLRVGNFARERRTLNVAVRGGGAEKNAAVDLESGASGVVRVELATDGPVTASLPTDALALDGEIKLPFSPPPEITVGLRPGLDPASAAALERFFSVAPAVKIVPDPRVTFGPPGADASVRIGATGKLRSFVGPFFAEKSDALLDDVPFAGVVWSVGDNPAGRPLVSMGSAVMMSVEDDGHLHLNVALGHSNLQRTAAWPVLLANILRDARLRLPGFGRKTSMLGEEADIVTDRESPYELESPRGTRRPLLADAALRIQLDEAGDWKLRKGGGGGAIIDTVTVLSLDARESDLRTRGPHEVHARTRGDTAVVRGDVRPRWLLAALLVLLVVDFWLTASPRGAGERLLRVPGGRP